MKTNNQLYNALVWAACALIGCGSNLHAQSPPAIITQPASQTNLAGSTVRFSVTAAGIGPFTYQWQWNGASLPNDVISTAAGIGSAGYSGDGGAATNARLYNPCSVVCDAFGNLYISDSLNNRIRRVNTNGIITTVAGNGAGAHSGDGGEAAGAGLHLPEGEAFDASGNLYIADNNNNCIRRVAPDGIITTVAGNGDYYYSGDGGAATNASLYFPTGVACDVNGNLYIADYSNNRIRKVAANGIITTVAGNGTQGYSGNGLAATNAGLYYPSGVACDAGGNLYISDRNNQRIRMVNTNGIISTVAGKGTAGYSGDGGAATNASLNYPDGLARDIAGNLYFADQFNGRIRKVDTNGIITTVTASLNYPSGVGFDAAGNLYIADYDNNRVREVHFSGYPTFMLSNLSITNAGNYSVVITSPYGSVTSAVASLTVTIPRTPPLIIANGAEFGFLTNQFGFNLNGAFGQTIVVDGSTNLVNWIPLFTNTANGSPFYFFDPLWTNFPWRFYRARLP